MRLTADALNKNAINMASLMESEARVDVDAKGEGDAQPKVRAEDTIRSLSPQFKAPEPK